jgi:uncharacterized protein (TIGR00251 family)
MTEKDQIIALHVIPKASRNEVVGWVATQDGERALKVKVTTAPEDGKANKAVIALLAGCWGCPRAGLEIISGSASRHKKLKIKDISLYARISGTMS